MWEEKKFEPDIISHRLTSGATSPYNPTGHVEKTAIQKLTDFLNEKNLRDFHIISTIDSRKSKIIGNADTITVLYFNKYVQTNRQI